MRIALAGNPNSGKTTLYNGLTGKNEHTGNWAGVTVEKQETKIKRSLQGTQKMTVVDLPGAYSMSPFTAEENVTRKFILESQVDVIINIVDATNLSRSLFFTTQLLELGIPVVVALNKEDINQKKQTVIDKEKLEALLHCPVIHTAATMQKGLEEVLAEAQRVYQQEQIPAFKQDNVDMENKEEVKKADQERFVFVNQLIKEVETRAVKSSQYTKQDQLDKVLVHKWLGLPVFAVIMWGVFSLSQTYIGPWLADYLCGGIDVFGTWVGEQIQGASPFLQALLVDGIIGGVGAVVGFLPLVMVMYFIIAILEDCGYMARVAVILDRFFRRVGLSGKSIIPMILGTGCAIPGVMACRTIRDERQRRTTAMLTPFMPCGAKLPVIALFAGVFFKDASWVGTTMYFVGILLIIMWALLVLKITGTRVRKNYFIMELPEYKIPSLKYATISMLERGKSYIIKAGTVILICNAIIQIMQSFTWSLQPVVEGAENTSILASVASPFAIIFIPLGFGIWQLAAAAITGFIAKENVVGTLAVVFGITNFIDPEAMELLGGAADVAATMQMTSVAALAYLMFNLFTPPCFAALGAMHSEIQEKKWFWGAVALQLGTGYVVAFLVYQVGTILTVGTVGAGFVYGLIAVLVLIGVVAYLIWRASMNSRIVDSKKFVSNI